MRIACIFLLLLFSALVIESPSQKDSKPAWQVPTGFNNPLALVVEKRDKKNFYYLAEQNGGLGIYSSDDESKRPRFVARVRPSVSLKKLAVTNLVQQENLLFLSLGEFFKKSSKAGVAIVDVQDPSRPVVKDVWVSKNEGKGTSTVLVDGDKVYLAKMKQGISIFRLDRNKKLEHLSSLLPDIHYPRRNPNEIQFPNSRGLAIKKNLLFIANDAGGLRVVDVANPKKPKEIAKYVNSKMGSKQQAFNNIVVDGKFAYIGVDYAGLEILNISNPKKIRQISWLNPFAAETSKNNWFNSPGHTNQVVLDKNKKRVYLSAGDSQILIVDIMNPKRPKIVDRIGKPKNKNGSWGVTLTDRFIYSIDIRAFYPFRGTWSGFKAFARSKDQ